MEKRPSERDGYSKVSIHSLLLSLHRGPPSLRSSLTNGVLCLAVEQQADIYLLPSVAVIIFSSRCDSRLQRRRSLSTITLLRVTRGRSGRHNLAQTDLSLKYQDWVFLLNWR